MTAYESALLTLVGLLFMVLLAIVATVRRRARWQHCRYRIFALRDEMVRLVAEGHLRSDDALYHHTVLLMNNLIRNMPTFTASEVAKGLIRADEADHQHLSWKEYSAALEAARPEVAEVVGRFWQAVAMALYENSVSLRALVWLWERSARMADISSRVAKRLGKPPSWQAYRLSQSHVRTAQGQLAPV